MARRNPEGVIASWCGRKAKREKIVSRPGWERVEGLRRLSLETGVQRTFIAARALYAKAGFVECGPFEGYVLDPNSVFMTRHL